MDNKIIKDIAQLADNQSVTPPSKAVSKFYPEGMGRENFVSFI